MKQAFFTILSTRQIAPHAFETVLAGDTSAITAPGQFVNIKIEGLFLRRPISVCDFSKGKLTLLYKVVGEGTRRLAEKKAGESLDLLVGLGNGFDVSHSGKNPLLIGGGIGVPPLYGLCKAILAAGGMPRVIMGFATDKEIVYQKEFAALGVSVDIATQDGSAGTRGYVTQLVDQAPYSYFYACGPEAMLRAVCHVCDTDGELSFEERMGCGFGACMGCSCQTLTGNKRICKEGPVLQKEEILW